MRRPKTKFCLAVDMAIALLAANIVATAQVPAPQPTNEAFVKSVSALPPEQQVERVVAKLKELNPTFDGKETHKVENGAVSTLSFSTVGVTDISPVKALQWLRTLSITPPTLNQKGSLSDLTPLKGLQLTWLWCHNNPISDLSPLQGMPLTVLSFGGTQVNDLSPLAGMKLQVVSFNDTVVSDIAPLEGMPLTVLWCNNTKVTDLAPVKAAPLREIKCDFVAERDAAVLRGIRTLAKINDMTAAAFWARVGPIAATATAAANVGGASAPRQTAAKPPQLTMPTSTPSGLSAKKQIEDFVAKMKQLNPQFNGQVKPQIEGGKIVELSFTTEAVTNITPVRELTRLKKLACTGPLDNVGRPAGQGLLSDLSPIKGLLLEELDCRNNPITDLAPVQGMPLLQLNCGYTEIADLSPLKGMRLESLLCHYTQISDLSALAKMPLIRLSCFHSKKIGDLSPLAGMRLKTLSFGDTQVNDLSPLKGMPLDHLEFYATRVRDLSPLKGMRLAKLVFETTQVTDLSMLKGMPLTLLRYDFNPERDTKILRSIKTLDTINAVPVKEFWKRVEAGEVPPAK